MTRPVHGLVALTDATAGRVVEWEDHGAAPLPQSYPYTAEHQGTLRADLKPIEITQPEVLFVETMSPPGSAST